MKEIFDGIFFKEGILHLQRQISSRIRLKIFIYKFIFYKYMPNKKISHNKKEFFNGTYFAAKNSFKNVVKFYNVLSLV